MAAVEHQHRGARALVLALDDHQVFVFDVDTTRRSMRCEVRGARCDMRGAGCGERRVGELARFALDGVQQRAGRIEVQGVAELVRLRRAGGFHAGRVLAGVVAAVAALAERTEQIAQRAVAEKVERLVGDLEGDRRLIRPVAGAAALAPLALAVQIGRCGDVAFVGHALDDLLDQILELRARLVLIAVGRVAKQPFDRLLRQHATIE